MNQKEYPTTFATKPAIIMAHIYAASLQLGEYAAGSTKPPENIPNVLQDGPILM